MRAHRGAARTDAGARARRGPLGRRAAARRARFARAPRDSSSEFSAWLPQALAEHVEAGHAVLSIYANDPDLLQARAARARAARPAGHVARRDAVSRAISRNQTNWAVVAAAARGWAAQACSRMRDRDEQVARLWDAIERLCRLDRPDPIARVGDAPRRRSRRARDVLNRAPLRRAAVPRPRDRSHRRSAGGPRLGQRPIDERQRDPLRAEPADRRSVHDAAHRIASTAPSGRPSRSATAAR